MKKTILAVLFASAVPIMAQTESNLNVRVDVPAALVDKAKMYMDMTGVTNITARQWLTSNVVVSLPQAVEDAVATRKADMVNKIMTGDWDFIRSILTKFGY